MTWHIWLQIDLADQTRKTCSMRFLENVFPRLSTVSPSHLHQSVMKGIHRQFFAGCEQVYPPIDHRVASMAALHFILDRTPRAKHSPLQNTSFGRRDGETNLGFHWSLISFILRWFVLREALLVRLWLCRTHDVRVRRSKVVKAILKDQAP